MGKNSKQKGQGQSKVPSAQQGNTQSCSVQSANNNNNNFSSSNMTDILGSSRELLYGGNGASASMNQIDMQQSQGQAAPYTQNFTNMTNKVGSQTTQEVGHMFVQPANTVSTDQSSGLLNQAFSNQNVYCGRPIVQHAHGSGGDIPLWASGLCQQMSQIQTLLDNHAKRWQSVENCISVQNEKFSNIEKQLLEIPNLRRELINTNSRIFEVENEMSSMQSKITEYDETIHSYSDMYDDITTNNSDIDIKFRDMDSRMRTIEKQISSMNQNIQETNEKLTDVRWRSMRENLLFFGIKEADGRDAGEDCENTIQTFIRNELEISKAIPLDRAHRIGRYNNRNARPRPIVVKFTFYKDRELVRLSAPAKLGGTNFGISEQYPVEIEERRRPLYDIAKKARQNTENKVKLVRDKLYINGEQYKPPPNFSNEKSTQAHPERSANQFHATNNSYKSRDGTTDADTQKPSLSRRSRVFTSTRSFTNAPPVENRNPQSVDIVTNNRFAALGNIRDTPPTSQSVRPGRVEKKKASSPLENVTTFKKQYLGDGSSRAGNDSVITDVEIVQSQENIQLSPRPIEINSTVQVLDFQSPSPSSNMTLQPSPVITMPSPTSDGQRQSQTNNGDAQGPAHESNTA